MIVLTYVTSRLYASQQNIFYQQTLIMCSELPGTEILTQSSVSNMLQLNSTCTAYQFPNMTQLIEFTSQDEGGVKVQVRQDNPNPIRMRFLNNITAGSSVCPQNAYCDVQGDQVVDKFVQSQMEQMR